ncbi:MAG: PAS domain S-box protein, partial [Planctomycetota bacterium]|nr:PAS domain S-box protein [Planctomycetota bacterium]
MRLYTKIILLIVAITLSVGVSSSFMVSRMMHNALESELRDQAVVAVQSLAEHIAHNVINGETVGAHEAVRKMVERSRSIQYAYIFDFDGRLFVHSFENGFPRALAATPYQHATVPVQSPQMVHLKTSRGRVLEIGYPVIEGMRAHVHIGMDEKRTYAQIASLRTRIVGLTLLLVAVGIAIGIFLSRRMTRPLADLAGAMRDFGERKQVGELEFRSGGREMADLTRAFNRMISDRKKAEEALEQSEKRYRGVVEDTPGLICRFLPGGEITYVNEAYCKYFAKTIEELVGSNFLSLIPEADRQGVMANISVLTVDSPMQSHEHPVIAPGGEIRRQRWTNRALFDDRGKVVDYQSVGEDITERKHAEAERESALLHEFRTERVHQFSE